MTAKGPCTAWESGKEMGIPLSVNHTLVPIHASPEIQGSLDNSCMKNGDPGVQGKKEHT